MASSDVQEAILQLLRIWPKSTNEPEHEIRSRLLGQIADSLPLPSLRTVPSGAWKVACPPVVNGGLAKVLVVDTIYPGTRVLAQLRLQAGRWALTGFDAECPVCFGAGVNNDCICDLCFGVGWGTYVPSSLVGKA